MDAFKAALWTALFTFIGTAGLALIGFLDAVADWIDGSNTDLSDDLSNLGKVLLAAVVAAGSAIINWLVRWAQSRDILPGSGPHYVTKAELPPPSP
jgi:hypothetical protein